MKNKLVLLSICISCIQLVLAQSDSDDLGVQEVQITEFFVPKIPLSTRIETIPTLKDTIKTTHPISYNPVNKQFASKLALTPIKAAKIKGHALPKIHRAYVYGGVGNMSLPTARFFYNSDRDRKTIYGIEMGYVESFANVKSAYNELQKISAAFRKTDFSIYAKKDLDFGILSAYAVRQGRLFQSYGYDPQAHNASEELNQQYWGYSSIRFMLEGKQNTKIGPKYSTKIFAYDLNERTENSISWSLDLSQKHDLNNYFLTLALDYDLNNNSTKYQFVDSLSKELIITVNPSLSRELYGGILDIGFEFKSFDMRNDTKVSTNIFPDIRYSYPFSKDYLRTTLGLRGNLEKNTYWTLSKKNPFILNALTNDGGSLELINSKKIYDAYFEFKTYLGHNLYIDTEGGYARVLDMPFFELDVNSTFQNKFNVIYDDVYQLYTHLNVYWEPTPKSTIDLLINYNNYQTDSLQSFNYKPVLTTRLKLKYNMGNKIIPQIEFFTAFKRSDNSTSSILSPELKDIIDFNIFLEYKYNPNISAYFKGYNMVGGYQIWENYPVLGPQVFFGLSFRL